MFHNRFLINLMLLVIVCLLGVKLYGVLSYSTDIPVKIAKKKTGKAKNEIRRKVAGMDKSTADLIASLDLFRPSRTPFIRDRKEAVISETKPGNPPKLFGTILLNDKKTAILQDPDSKRSAMYNINDKIAGYTVSNILEEKVVLLKNGEKLEIKLREDKGITPSKRPARKSRLARNAKKPEQKTQPAKRPRRRRPVRRRSVKPPQTPDPNAGAP